MHLLIGVVAHGLCYLLQMIVFLVVLVGVVLILVVVLFVSSVTGLGVADARNAQLTDGIAVGSCQVMPIWEVRRLDPGHQTSLDYPCQYSLFG